MHSLIAANTSFTSGLASLPRVRLQQRLGFFGPMSLLLFRRESDWRAVSFNNDG
jgi:hypothetical protein